MSNWTDDIKRALSQEDIAQGLSLFLANNQSADTETTLIMLSGRWNRLRQEESQATIGRSDANIERAKIKYALLETLKDVEASTQSLPPTPNGRNETKVEGNGNIIIQGVTGSHITIVSGDKS
jgi:hypothetical protein